MGKSLFIAEKPSVANEFAKALKQNMSNRDGYKESEEYIVTWCVGHLVTMSYPDAYDEIYKKWRLDTLPFIPDTFKYEIIKSAAKQFDIVAGLLNRADVDTIYVCTDSGREGEYIYRLVEQQADVKDKNRKRVWIDSQTEEEILRGIREAKDLSEFDNLSDAAYLRAKEDYLMGINFSRVLTLKYGYSLAGCLKENRASVSVGRVMTCVLGMVVNREREIRDFVKTPFYRVIGNSSIADSRIPLEWRVQDNSKYYESPLLYSEKGFKKKDTASELIDILSDKDGTIVKIEKKPEKKNAPLLYNLAELQNDCSKMFKISPDETLSVIQELYEKKLCTYPRTDARVLSTAVCKEITKNISGLKGLAGVKPFVDEILDNGLYKGIEKSRYCDDKKITDHYAIIPTGQGLQALAGLSKLHINVYEAIVRRFLAIFFPAAIYEKVTLDVAVDIEHLYTGQKYLKDNGYLKVMDYSFKKKKDDSADNKSKSESDTLEDEDLEENAVIKDIIDVIKKGDIVHFINYDIKEGETAPPKRYNSGSLILAMENAGQLIEDEELRAQIKGSGIGTSATRAEILKKLVANDYLSLNKKTQIITPTLKGEMINDIVRASIPSLLDPRLTASWEKGLTGVADGTITSEEYMNKLSSFVRQKTEKVKSIYVGQNSLNNTYNAISKYYK
ncbi:MAG: type IA DNA topoisomerase [Pseudobutyrivibrio sp.]|nr:type IA DNA topoisomerase [Pseudobutyrivibrio sp.]